MSLTVILLAAFAIIPAPRSMTCGTGVFRLTAGKDVADCATVVTDKSLPPEGYRLTVSTDGISVAAADTAGAFYAKGTLQQIVENAVDGTIPAVEVVDSPEFGWRGLLLDECRHFFGKQTVKRVLDVMGRYRLNRLDWHLTEDQGIRLDVPGYPELAKYASVRAASPAKDWMPALDKEVRLDGQRYGPFYYTEAEVKEIVEYATARQVTIVPAIDFPAHCCALFAAYPEFTCNPQLAARREPLQVWGGDGNRPLCIGNPKALKFVDDLIDYVCRAFPGKYVNLNADECFVTAWNECPKCRALMAEKGIEKADGLYAWFVRRMIARVERNGKVALAADEILNCADMPRSVIPISWRMSNVNGMDYMSGPEAVRRGFDVIMQPHMGTYFCYGQGLEDDPYLYEGWPERRAGGGQLTLNRCYMLNPLVGFSTAERRHVLGANFCCWSEYISTEPELMWKLLPRACALAEVFWTGMARPGFADFRRRMEVERRRLQSRGYNCAPLSDPPSPRDVFDRPSAMTPESHGLYTSCIYEWLKNVGRRFGKIRGVSIVRHGQVLFEAGETMRRALPEPNTARSETKAFVSTAAYTFVIPEKDAVVMVTPADEGVFGTEADLFDLIHEWIVPSLHDSPRKIDSAVIERTRRSCEERFRMISR